MLPNFGQLDKFVELVEILLNMKIIVNSSGGRIRYAAPDCDLCEAAPGALLCESATTVDWVYDDDNDMVV